jgi:hypothetical protein
MTGWAGVDQTAYRRNEWLPTAQNVLFRNSWWHTQNIFEIVPQSACPGGSRITWGIDYSSTANGGAFTRGDAMPASDTLVGIAAYQTKDWFQAAAKISGIDKAEMAGNGSEIAMDLTSKAISAATKNLIQAQETAFAADFVALIDAASNTFSDAALTRATYSLASYEETSGAAVTLANLEQLCEELGGTTYGPIDMNRAVLCMSVGQTWNVARLTSNLGYQATFAQMTTSLDSSAPIDGGRQYRNLSFNGVPIVVIPGLSDTDIIMTSRDNVKIYMHHDLEITTKDTAEYADLYHLVAGANLVVLDPLRAGKLSAKTV